MLRAGAAPRTRLLRERRKQDRGREHGVVRAGKTLKVIEPVGLSPPCPGLGTPVFPRLGCANVQPHHASPSEAPRAGDAKPGGFKCALSGMTSQVCLVRLELASRARRFLRPLGSAERYQCPLRPSRGTAAPARRPAGTPRSFCCQRAGEPFALWVWGPRVSRVLRAWGVDARERSPREEPSLARR